MTTPLLTAQGIGRTYHRGSERVQALDEVSFTLTAGEVVAVTGPSGSGKTTLLNIVAGWESPDRGTLRWGLDDVDPTAPRWDVLAVAPQRLGLLPELSIRENVELPLRLAGDRRSPDDARVDTQLDEFGLRPLAHRMPWEVSLGEQQRAALARARVVSPRLLLADEPTGHQDVAWATEVMETLTATATGTTLLIASHDDEVIARCPRTLALHDGHLV